MLPLTNNQEGARPLFSRLLKPNWEHKDPNKRKAAVARLSVSDDKHIEILNRIAMEDTDSDVRCEAISKLNNISLLQSISANDVSEKVLDAANARISCLLMAMEKGSPPLADRIATLKEIGNSRMAETILRDAQEPEMQITAVECLEDQSLLSSIALSSDSTALRQAAARQIHDQEALHTLSKSSKHHDKNVYRIVREKLAATREKAKESSQGLSRKEHLLKSMEMLSKSACSSLYSGKYHQLVSQWSTVANLDYPDLEQRFEQAKLVCQRTISQHEAQQLEQQKHIEQNRVGHEQRLDLCHSTESILDDLMQSPYAGEPAATELQELLNHYQVTWKSIAAELSPTQEEQKRFDRASHSLGDFIVTVQRVEKKLDNSDKLLAQATRLLNEKKLQQLERMQQTKSALEHIIEQVAWPESFPPLVKLNHADKAVQDLDAAINEARKSQGQALKMAEEKLEQLSGYIDEGAVQSANGLRGEIRALVNQLGNRKTAAIGKQFAHLSHKLDELNDWKNFAATPKKAMLIEKMEGLVESDLSMQDRANLIKELENEWKSLGRGGKDRAESDELWARFKGAADSAYEPCKQYFSAQRDLRKENLRQRKVICDELEHFVESTNWDEVDWKKVDKIVHLGRDEWRKYSSVDRSAGRQVQQRFDRLIGGINDRLDGERKANASLKHDLVNQMEALVEREELRAAINEAKQLQKEWSRIGITHRAEDRRLWTDFRTACDQVFDRRTQENQARDEERGEQLKLAEALCEKLEQAAGVELSSWDDSAIHPDALSMEFNSLGPLPRESQSAVQSRFDDAVTSYKKRSEQYREHLEEQKATDAKRFSDRCAEIEYGVMSDALEVSDAEIEQLRAELAGSSLDSTFISAIRLRVDNAADSRGNPDLLTRQLDDNLNTLRLLCIRLEVLTGNESPAEDQELRMTYQVNRLTEGMMGTSSKADSMPEQLSVLTHEWLATGPVGQKEKSELQSRWDSIMRVPQ
jgi:exonuclease SbcC